MIAKITDTDANSDKIQTELIRQATVSKRIQIMGSLSANVRNLSYRAIRRANPDISEQAADIAFVDLHYGHDLAKSLQHYLENKK